MRQEANITSKNLTSYILPATMYQYKNIELGKKTKFLIDKALSEYDPKRGLDNPDLNPEVIMIIKRFDYIDSIKEFKKMMIEENNITIENYLWEILERDINLFFILLSEVESDKIVRSKSLHEIWKLRLYELFSDINTFHNGVRLARLLNLWKNEIKIIAHKTIKLLIIEEFYKKQYYQQITKPVEVIRKLISTYGIREEDFVLNMYLWESLFV